MMGHADNSCLKAREKHLRIGTRNIRNLQQNGKLPNLILETGCLDLDIL